MSVEVKFIAETINDIPLIKNNVYHIKKILDYNTFELEEFPNKIFNVKDFSYTKLHPKIQLFANQMQTEMLINSNKGDWETFLDIDLIMQEFYYHIQKLEWALDKKDETLLKERIADTSNILLFLGNAFNLYNK